MEHTRWLTLLFVSLQARRQVAVTAAKKGFGAAESKQV
jgi:hypothetical protein